MRDKIIKIMSAVFEQSIDEGSSVDNIDGWDSLKHLKLITELEGVFNIRIPDDDIPNMINFKLIKFIIDEQVRLQPMAIGETKKGTPTSRTE